MSSELATLPGALGEAGPEAEVAGKPSMDEITQQRPRRAVTHRKKMFTPWGENLRSE